MRSLEQSLLDHELITLRVIGEWWELDLTGIEKNGAAKAIAEKLAQIDLQQEMIFLPEEEVAALKDLAAQGGKAPVAVFGRDHGEIRLMGPGRMEREEPWLYPVSAAEALWYRGFLYRAFDETAEGLIEFYYLPKEFMASFTLQESSPPDLEAPALQPLVDEPVEFLPAFTDAVDDLTALLAVALKLSQKKEERPDLNMLLLNPDPDRRSMLLTLAYELGLVRRTDGQVRPTRTAVNWLKQNRDAQLYALADAWSKSEWNDLCHTPGLVCEGNSWQNDPILARTALLDALERTNQWYRISDLVHFTKEMNPDFQRPDGNYNTWYIRHEGQEEYLAGFDSWDDVEGQLLRFLIKGPLHWLGMVDLADLGQSGLEAFRLTQRAFPWLAGDIGGRKETFEGVKIRPEGTVTVPRNADRYIRFQVARIGEPSPLQPGKPYRYQITANSLKNANEQGINSDRILQFLSQISEEPLPKSVERSVVRWMENGVEARMEQATILRVKDERILDTLRTNSRTKDYLGETLGDLAAIVKPGMSEKLRLATAQLGLLLEIEL